MSSLSTPAAATDMQKSGSDPILRRDQTRRASFWLVIMPPLNSRVRSRASGRVNRHHHAELAVAALFIQADLAKGLSREVKTAFALAHLAASRQQGIGEGMDLFFGLPEQVQRPSVFGRGEARSPAIARNWSINPGPVGG